MARPSIEDIRNLGDFATVFHWNFKLIQPPSGVAAVPSSEELNWRCTTVALPKRTSTSTEVQIRGHKVKQPGVFAYDNAITITFVETVDTKITKFLYAWSEASWKAKTGVQKLKTEVEGIVELELLNRQDEFRQKYTLTGCFLESFDPGGDLADGSSSDAIKPTLTISYDFFEIE